jgi:hypothetical protein
MKLNETRITYTAYLACSGSPYRVDVTSTPFDQLADAEALLALFPKSLKLQIVTCAHCCAGSEFPCDYCKEHGPVAFTYYLAQSARLSRSKQRARSSASSSYSRQTDA